MFAFLRRLGNAAAGSTPIPGGLTGNFDLHGDTITGLVNAIPYATNTGVIVEVLRHGRIIASCETEPENEDEELPFTLPLEGRFSAAEIARETVTFTVRSRRGDTGTLTLNGATQLELVRAHLGVPVQPVIELDFSRDGNAGPYLGEGWSGAEDHLTWTLDSDSFIHFRRPTEPGTYLLRFTCGAFIMPMAPIQMMDIYVNDTEIAAFTTDTNAMDFREFRFDADCFAAARRTTLRLHHPYAGLPSEHSDSGDTRRLGFSFRRLSVVRVLPETD